MIIDKAKALKSLRPGAEWVLRGDTIEWLDTKQTRPTDNEIANEVARLEVEYDAAEYQRKRVKEYPSITDQLDALWKGGDAAEEMLAKVQAVKTKYPKE